MDTIQQTLPEQAGAGQCSQNSDDGTQIPWKCNYRPEDDLLLASKHAYFQDVSISPDMHRIGDAACLRVQVDIGRVDPDVLCNAVLRVVIQDKPGTRFFLWESGVIDQVQCADPVRAYSLHMSIPMQCSQLKPMEEGGVYYLKLILEGAWGSVLDSASGEIIILSR